MKLWLWTAKYAKAFHWQNFVLYTIQLLLITCSAVHVHYINVLLTVPAFDATTMFSPLNQ